MTELLTITQLNVTHYKGYERKKIPIIKNLDLSIKANQITGIVGESGAGKSILMKTLMDILPENFESSWASFTFDGETVANERLSCAMIFQDPKKALDPVKTIGAQLIEVICRFQKVSKKAARDIALADLTRVGISQPAARLQQYPHELSGGICQRVLIAMALATQAKLLIADEPTTALDVITQQQILRLLKKLQQENNLTILLISHDFKVIRQLCDQVCVLYFGELIEKGTLTEIMERPKHPYTQALLELSTPEKFSGQTLKAVKGHVPKMGENIVGCFFYERCLKRMPHCQKTHPPLFTVSATQKVRCFLQEKEASLDENTFIGDSKRYEKLP